MNAVSIQSFPLSDQRVQSHTQLRAMQSPKARPLPFPVTGEGHVLIKNSEPRAFVATFSAEHMRNTPKQCGILGFYESLSQSEGLQLLEYVEQFLREQGLTSLIGPMNQNTWGQYRFALPSEPSDPKFEPHTFLGDVTNDESYPAHFEATGFRPISFYESRATRSLFVRHRRYPEIKEQLRAQGVDIVPMDMSRFNEILQEIFWLSLQGFSNNRFYAPIEFPYFRSLYDGIHSIIDPQFFLLARNREGRLVGFIFAYQDPLAVEKRVILKSMTIDHSVRGMGLGLFLMDEIQRIAAERHFDMAIHALMYVDNTTKGISEGGMHSQIFKRYALYQKEL